MRDDGIGIRVAEELRHRSLGKDVNVYEYQQLDLSLIERLQGASKVLLVDALQSGKLPGTVSKYSIAGADGPPVQLPSLHGLRLGDLFALAGNAGLLDCPVTIVGVEPRDCRPGERMSLELEASLPSVVNEVVSELETQGYLGREPDTGRRRGRYRPLDKLAAQRLADGR